MASKVLAKAVAERMSVEQFTRMFITKARGTYAGVNSVVSKLRITTSDGSYAEANFNDWYRSYQRRGLLEAAAPESPVDATKALEAAGKLVLGRGRPTGVYMVLPEDSIKGQARMAKASALDALTI